MTPVAKYLAKEDLDFLSIISNSFFITLPNGTVDQPLANLAIRQYRCTDHDEVVQLYLDGMRSYAFEGEDEASETLWEQVRQASVNSDLADIEGVYLTSGGNYWVAVV
ncbi:Acyl-CoA N-acyltransferase [Phytophthora cactorum]|nr:Acyl-CoA N-acyltransferase [Phytophthora cactorum]